MDAKKVLVVALTLLALGVAVCAQQCPAETAFRPCLQYVTPGQDNGVPSKGDDCCNLVMNLSEDCLCTAATQPSPAPGITIDFQKALGLPKACGRAVPPQTTCNGTPVPP